MCPEAGAQRAMAADRLRRLAIETRAASGRPWPAHIAVVGEFNSGKTTLANALIGAPVLPVSTAARTPCVTVVGYAATRGLVAEGPGSSRAALDWSRIGCPTGGTRRMRAGLPLATLRRLRNIALLETLRSTGARVGEVVALRRADLTYERQAAVVTGKGGKQRLIYFDDSAWGALGHYLQVRQDGASGRALASLPLFARHDLGAGSKVLPISTNTVRSVVNEFCQAAGLDEPVTPHLFRHRFATGVLSATHDLAATQDLLGHSSPTTTRIYARLTEEDTAEAHRQAQERGRI